MADFNEPQLNSTYTTFLSTLKARDTDLAALFASDTVSTSNFPARAVRFNTTSNKFERRNSGNTDFEDLTTNFHFPAVTIDGSGDLDVGGDISATSITVTGLVSGGGILATGSSPTATGLYRPAGNTLGITTNTQLRWTIDSTGRLFNNGTTTFSGGTDERLQVMSSAGGRIGLLRNDGSVGANNIIGTITAYNRENANDVYSACAEVRMAGDGSFSTTSHPTRIEFHTTDTSSVTKRAVACIDQNGFLGVGPNVGVSPSYPLHVNSGGTNNAFALVSTDSTVSMALSDSNSGGIFDNRIAGVGDQIQVHTNGSATPILLLNNSQECIINRSSAIDESSGTPINSHLQVYGTSSGAAISLVRGTDDTTPADFEFIKIRNTDFGLSSAVQSGDSLGNLFWKAADGSALNTSQRIRARFISPDLSGNTVSVASGRVPSQLEFGARNNDNGFDTYLTIDHNGHMSYKPHSQPSGGGQNEYAIDINTTNSSGTGNLVRFTNRDTTIGSGQKVGGLQFFSSDTGAENNGLLGEFFVDAEDGTPHGRMAFNLSGTRHITILGEGNSIGLHKTNPEYPLDVLGNALFDGKVCISTDRAGFISMNDDAALQVTGNANAESMINVTRVGDSTTSFPTVVLTKNHNSSPTSNTTCPSGSTLGGLEFQGTNGTGFDVGARILAKTSSAWSSSSHSTNLIFQASNGDTLGSFMALTNQGCLNIGDSGIETDYSTDGDTRLTVIDSSGPSILLHRRDSSVNSSNEIGSILAGDSDGGLPAAPSARIRFVASQGHSATAKGTDIVLGMCENSTTTITNRFTFRDSGAFGVNGDSIGSSGDCLISKGNSPPEYQPVAARAWVNFDGTGTVAIKDSYNVSSITDNGTGDYHVTFSTAIGNDNYAALVSHNHQSSNTRIIGTTGNEDHTDNDYISTGFRITIELPNTSFGQNRKNSNRITAVVFAD